MPAATVSTTVTPFIVDFPPHSVSLCSVSDAAVRCLFVVFCVRYRGIVPTCARRTFFQTRRHLRRGGCSKTKARRQSVCICVCMLCTSVVVVVYVRLCLASGVFVCIFCSSTHACCMCSLAHALCTKTNGTYCNMYRDDVNKTTCVVSTLTVYDIVGITRKTYYNTCNRIKWSSLTKHENTNTRAAAEVAVNSSSSSSLRENSQK